MPSAQLDLPDDLSMRLTSLAQRTGRPEAFYILEAVRSYLDDLEDAYEADMIMQAVRRGEERLYSSGEVGKLLGLEN